MSLWDVKKCMNDGIDGDTPDVDVEIVGMKNRHPYKNDPNKFLQKFDVFAYEYQNQKKLKTLTLFNAPDIDVCAKYIGQKMVATGAKLVVKDNEHQPGKTYLAEITAHKLLTPQEYQEKKGSAKPELMAQKQPIASGSTPAPSVNRTLMSNEEQKTEVKRINDFLMILFDEWTWKYAEKDVPWDSLQKLAVTSFLTCRNLHLLPNYDPEFVEPEAEPKLEPEPTPEDRESDNKSEVSAPPVSDDLLARQLSYQKEHPKTVTTCTVCKETFKAQDLNFTNYGAYCKLCDDIPF